MDLPNLLKRLRGDDHVRTEVASLRRSLANLQEQIERLDDHVTSGPRVPRERPAKRRSQSEGRNDDEYLAGVLKAYRNRFSEWLAMDAPWYTGPATRWLERHLRSDDSVFEYGSGRSTVWWCQRAGAVTTLEASPEWIAYLNFYLSARPELMAKLQTIHVPADWNPEFEGGVKRYWGRRRDHLTPEMIETLERRYLQVETPPSASVIAFDGSIRSLTMARWALDGRGPRGADILVVDNTEKGTMSGLTSAIAPDYVRLDFPFGPGDVVPEGQKGKHITSVLVSPPRMERCDRGEALPAGADLTPHMLSPEKTEHQIGVALGRYEKRLRRLGIFTAAD